MARKLNEDTTDLIEDVAKAVLTTVAKKAIPSAASMAAGPLAGIAVGALIVAATKIYEHRQKMSREGIELRGDERDIVLVNEELERLYERRRKLEQALGRAPPRRRRLIENTIAALDNRIEMLEEYYELLQLRIEAMRRLDALGGKKLVKEVEKIMDRIEKGKPIDKELYRVIKEAEERLEKINASETVLLKILET